jgi:hypothetical protein
MPQEIGQIYKTLIPSLSDDASIEEALQMYHYGTAAYNGNNLQPQSIEKHIIDLNEDVSRIDGTISSLANVYIEETSSTTRPNTIVSQEAVVVPLTIRGVVNQTAALQKWQKNTGTVSDVALINNAGSAAFSGYLSVGSATISTSTALPITLSGNNKGITVRGISGQTENLQEWQNNTGTALSYVDNLGNLNISEITAQNVGITGQATINALVMESNLTAEEITASKITLSGVTGLIVQNDSSLEGDVDILGTTTTKNISADGTIEATGNIETTADITAQGDLNGANLNLSQSMTTTGNITANGIIKAKSPNQGSTGGVKILGDVDGNSYLQFVNAGDTLEFGNIKGSSDGITLSTNTFVSGGLTVVSPSASGSVGVRQVYISTGDPTGADGADGDLWVKYI